MGRSSKGEMSQHVFCSARILKARIHGCCHSGVPSVHFWHPSNEVEDVFTSMLVVASL